MFAIVIFNGDQRRWFKRGKEGSLLTVESFFAVITVINCDQDESCVVRHSVALKPLVRQYACVFLSLRVAWELNCHFTRNKQSKDSSNCRYTAYPLVTRGSCWRALLLTKPSLLQVQKQIILITYCIFSNYQWCELCMSCYRLGYCLVSFLVYSLASIVGVFDCANNKTIIEQQYKGFLLLFSRPVCTQGKNLFKSFSIGIENMDLCCKLNFKRKNYIIRDVDKIVFNANHFTPLLIPIFRQKSIADACKRVLYAPMNVQGSIFLSHNISRCFRVPH